MHISTVSILQILFLDKLFFLNFYQFRPYSNSIHTDQTRAFPFTPQQGNRYIMVAIYLDANYIFVKPLCNRLKEEKIRAYKKIINGMRLAGLLGLMKHKLDNKVLEAFKQCIWEQQMQYELVPLDNHQPNQAERAIQTFKAHFILILAALGLLAYLK